MHKGTYVPLGSPPLRIIPEQLSDDHLKLAPPPASIVGTPCASVLSVTAIFSFPTPSVNNTEVRHDIDLLVSDKYIMYAAQDIAWVTIAFPLRLSGLVLNILAMRSSFGRVLYFDLYIIKTAARLLSSKSNSTLKLPFTGPASLQNDQV